jgi:hypothetical protein
MLNAFQVAEDVVVVGRQPPSVTGLGMDDIARNPLMTAKIIIVVHKGRVIRIVIRAASKIPTSATDDGLNVHEFA